MSQENVEIVRAGFAAFNRGDYEAALAAFHPEVEWVPYLGALQGSIHRGRQALLEMWNDINQNLGGAFQVEAQEFIDCGEKIVVVVEARGTGSSSGAELRQKWAQVASLQDRLVIRVEPFPTREEALEATGLQE